MKKNLKLQIVALIIVIMLISSSTAIGQNEGEASVKSYWLTKRVLIVAYGDTYLYPLAAINTKKGIVIIDSGMPPSITKMYRKRIKKELGRSDFKYLINTHSHSDHFEGNQVFKETEIIAHKNALKKMIEEKGFYEKELTADIKMTRKTIKRRNLLKNTLKKDTYLYKHLRDSNYMYKKMCDDYETIFKLTLPSITFTDNLTLDMGDLKIHLVYFGPDYHSGNDIVISIPAEKLVFTGDIIAQKDFFAESSFNAKSSFTPWIACLDKIFQNNRNINNVVTFHFGVLPGTVLSDFYYSLKSMQKDQQQKMNAVGNLRSMISELGLKKAEKKFEFQFMRKKENKYFIWEREMISLAKEYQREKKFNEAIVVLSLCKRIFPESATANNMLGANFKMIGKKNRAIQAYKKCLEIGPINVSSTADKIFQLENSK